MTAQKQWIDGPLTQSTALCPVERIDSEGIPWVRLPEGRLVPARTTTNVSTRELQTAAEQQLDAVVALVGEPQELIILGIVANHGDHSLPIADPTATTAEVDGKTIVLTGHDQIVLRCGEASIRLTKAGKIIIRGTYLSSRSSGVNRINGGSVQIN